jgi:hypothetical protein
MKALDDSVNAGFPWNADGMRAGQAQHGAPGLSAWRKAAMVGLAQVDGPRELEW